MPRSPETKQPKKTTAKSQKKSTQKRPARRIGDYVREEEGEEREWSLAC
uniref:Uncharacterized protein n=1 Tax=Arundo donax TaxID=35708 RepID=A0A0A9D0G2_ARUDO